MPMFKGKKAGDIKLIDCHSNSDSLTDIDEHGDLHAERCSVNSSVDSVRFINTPRKNWFFRVLSFCAAESLRAVIGVVVTALLIGFLLYMGITLPK